MRGLITSFLCLMLMMGLAVSSEAAPAKAKPDSLVPGKVGVKSTAQAQGQPPAPTRPGTLAGTAENSSPDLAVRIGDVLYLALPGEDTLNKSFQVDRRGNLQLPEIGLVNVAGLSIAQAQETVRTALAKVFRDMTRFELALKERRLLVTVLGYAKQPGPVELPGDATVQMAVNAAGGLAPGAQLDRLQLRRGRDVINFDYKKYLDTGDPSLVPALQPLDEIFIPASPLTGNVQVEFDARTLTSSGDGGDDRSAIKVFGEVNSPGSFAYKPEASILEYVMRAGGVTRYSTVEGIRVITKNQPQLFNLKEYLDTGRRDLLPLIAPGTTIYIPKEIEEVKGGQRTVYVMGEVFKPGAFETKPTVSFLDVLANAGGPTRFADTSGLRILHQDGTVDQFNLLSYTEAKTKNPPLPKLQPGDAIFVPEKAENDQTSSWLKYGPDRIVRIIGAINAPGRYEWNDTMSILDLIAEAGGPGPRANTARIQILPSDKGPDAKVELFDLGALLEKGGRLDQLPVIKPGYTVTIPELPDDVRDNRSNYLKQSPDNSIYLIGAFRTPGRFAFSKDVRFLDILSAADGPAGNADLENIRVTRRHGGNGPATIVKVDLNAYFNSGDERLLPELDPGDLIFIPERGADYLTQSKESTIRVLGSVARPGRYRFNDSMTLLDLLAEAGGPTPDAYQEKIVVINFTRDDQDRARTFNLVQFAKTGNFRDIPVLRAGDTVYIPNISQSDFRMLIDGVKDVVSVLSVFALIGRL